ncbi:MAG: adenylate kinase [Candidatus Nanohaloarchaea archaeon]
MSKVNILVGLSGVGKSTVLEEAMLLSDHDYEVINYGDRFLEIAKDEDVVNDRDELKNIEVEKFKELQRRAAESIVDDAEDEDVIVDTHAAIESPYGFIPGLPKWTLEHLEPEKIIILDADPEEIFARSERDEDRDREHESVNDVRLYRDVAREMAAAGSVMTGAYLKVIENPPNAAHEAAEELLETLNG